MMKLDIKDLAYRYETSDGTKLPVIDNINLIIEKGDFVVIIGESGCGKTTLLHLLAGLLIPSQGIILVDEKEIKGPHYLRPLIFQNPCLLPWLNVKENIAFGCKLRKDMKNLNNRIDKYIKLMGLDGFEKAYPARLSLGMAQRVSFARSLISLPEILLLDEPFSALDFFNRTKLQSELIKNWLYQQYTVIFVTHDIDEAILLGKKIIFLGNRPSKIEFIVDINQKYPRELSNKKLIELKIDLQKKFEEIKKKHTPQF